MKHQTGTDSEWQLLSEAAHRLGRHPGHLRRVCFERLHKEGKARWVKGDGKRPHWEVRKDATLDFRRSGADLKPIRLVPSVKAAVGAIQLTIGSVTIIHFGSVPIVIRVGDAMTIPTPGTGRGEAFEEPTKAL